VLHPARNGRGPKIELNTEPISVRPQTQSHSKN
jgi:hypothetical protein